MRPRHRHLPRVDDYADVPFRLVRGVQVIAALQPDRGQRALAAAGASPEEVRAGERGHEGVARTRHELGRCSELSEPSLHEDSDLVGERRRVLVVVRHEQSRQRELPQQLRELVPHLGLRVCVERGQRLVEEEHRGVTRQCPRERDPLPLAARELAGMRGGEVADPEPLQ